MWIKNVLVSFDQFFKTLTYPLWNLLVGRGGVKFDNPDETLSSVFGKNLERGTCPVCRVICRFLDLFDKDHCIKSIERDE